MTPLHLIGGVVVSDWNVVALAVTLTMLLALALYLRDSRRGQYLIAVADNPALAELYRIGRHASFRLTMVFAAVGMVLLGTKATAVPSTALQQSLVISVVATVLAGIGRVFAAEIAALLLGAAGAQHYRRQRRPAAAADRRADGGGGHAVSTRRPSGRRTVVADPARGARLMWD